MFNESIQINCSFTRRKLIATISVLMLFLVAFISCGTASAKGDTSSSPGPLAEGDVIYQVLVDRFSDGDSSNNDLGDGAYRPNDLGFYHGGDWKGLTDKLDYIANLGVTAIWISPVSEQEPVSKDGNEGSYHGFFTKNYATPNQHFGSKAELQELIDTAHGKGLKMILDVVPNHTADYLNAYSASYVNDNYQPRDRKSVV